MMTKEQAVDRLQELHGWAQYIEAALAVDEPWEPGKMEYLRAAVEPAAVEQARREALRLSLHLYEILITLEGVNVPIGLER